MANKGIKNCSTSLVIREMQIKTSFRVYFIPARMAILKKTNSKGYPLLGLPPNSGVSTLSLYTFVSQ
jgi:hypothetical protein